MREKREQNLTLTLPAKKDSGSLLEDSFDIPSLTAETQQAINRAGAEIARMAPAIAEKIQKNLCPKDMEKRLQDSQRMMQEQQQKMQERQQKLRHELSGEWAEI
jgi:hypothetical protein